MSDAWPNQGESDEAHRGPGAPDPYELHCLEVWGGSDAADHAASVPGLDVYISSRPVDGDQGGDLYLVSSCSSGWISRMLLADVSGHGRAVSAFSGKLRKAMHRSINTVDQSKIARALNAAFDEISGGSRFATALLMTYYAPGEYLLLVNAGHPPPLLRRAGAEGWEAITPRMPGVIGRTTREVRVGVSNLPLGVIGSTEYEQIAVRLSPGDQLCAYTDAYTEARDARGSLLGVDGFKDALGAVLGDAAELGGGLTRRLHDAITGAGYAMGEDDQTLMLITRNTQARPRITVPIVGNWIKNNFGLGHRDTFVGAGEGSGSQRG